MLCQLSYARSKRTGSLLPRFFVQRVPSELLIVLHQLQSLSTLRLFRDSVISQPSFGTLQPNILSSHVFSPDTLNHKQRPPVDSGINAGGHQDQLLRDYSIIFVTTPEPTVLPPSRIANRTFSVIAIGLPSVTCMLTLSPGIHISAPPSSVDSPVTSVVRK